MRVKITYRATAFAAMPILPTGTALSAKALGATAPRATAFAAILPTGTALSAKALGATAPKATAFKAIFFYGGVEFFIQIHSVSIYKIARF